MIVFDASALLAFLHGEQGSDLVERSLLQGGVCGSANWSEVAQKTIQFGADWSVARGLLLSYPLTIEPVTPEDGEQAALLWRTGSGLSLADRLCLADQAWGDERSNPSDTLTTLDEVHPRWADHHSRAL